MCSLLGGTDLRLWGGPWSNRLRTWRGRRGAMMRMRTYGRSFSLDVVGNIHGCLCLEPSSWRWCLAAVCVCVCVRYRSGTTVAAGAAQTVDSIDVPGVLGRSSRALERMLRSKNSAKESCVAASVNETPRGLPVLLETCALLRSLHPTEVEPCVEKGVW